MLHTEDQAFYDVSLHNKNCLDNNRNINIQIEPIKQVGGQLLSQNEINVNIIIIIYVFLLHLNKFEKKKLEEHFYII